MSKFRNAFLALIVASGAIVLASNGIEVLEQEFGIEVLSETPTANGIEVLSQTTGAPAGSVMEAWMNIDGYPVLVHMSPIDPAQGLALSIFPMSSPTNTLQVRTPDGTLFAAADGALAGLDFD